MTNRKYKNEKGFTLAELLIVVAIIAVLVAVSIPIFTAQLEKAREETDAANWRAAKAAFIVELLDAHGPEGPIMHYDAGMGKVFYEERNDFDTYGEGSGTPGYDSKSFEFSEAFELKVIIP